MHHYRGKLLEGDAPRLDPANIYVQFDHPTAQGPVEGWRGYLLIASETDVKPGLMYQLRLEDGRAGRLVIDKLDPDESGKFRAYFVGHGPLG
jgi:hypothetical protein